ncbi:hypothetical protein [Yersinia phage MHG19]|nr:hypothetical protein [Yersinia phage MHG19]
MFNVKIVVLCALLGLVLLLKLATNQIDSLKSDVKVLQDATEQQAVDIEALRTDFDSIQSLYNQREALKKEQAVLEKKLRGDTKREATVVAKPKLVEKKVNESFNKFTAEFSEITK